MPSPRSRGSAQNVPNTPIQTYSAGAVPQTPSKYTPVEVERIVDGMEMPPSDTAIALLKTIGMVSPDYKLSHRLPPATISPPATVHSTSAAARSSEAPPAPVTPVAADWMDSELTAITDSFPRLPSRLSPNITVDDLDDDSKDKIARRWQRTYGSPPVRHQTHGPPFGSSLPAHYPPTAVRADRSRPEPFNVIIDSRGVVLEPPVSPRRSLGSSNSR